MNILDLSENEIEKIKKQLTENGSIIKKTKISDCDAKFSDAVVLSAVLLKRFIYVSIALYVALIVFGFVLSFVYKTYNNVNLSVIAAVFVICFITVAIFNNVNSDKKKETHAVYIKEGNFIFNFCNGVAETPDLFYVLSYTTVKQIDVLIYGIKKEHIYGKVTFVFDLPNCEVTHTVAYTDFTTIETYIKNNFPSLTEKITVDDKNKSYCDRTVKKTEITNTILAWACFAASALFIIVPLAMNYRNPAVIIAGVILLLTSAVIFVSKYVYTNLEQGALISGIFIIIGYCVPLFFILQSELTLLQCLAQNVEILLPTMLGNIGLCLYVYILCITVGKIRFKLKYRKNKYNL